MTEIIIFAAPILFFAAIAWAANRFLPFTICAICAGVSLSWFLVMAGITAGFLETENWSLVAAIAMGGTAVGLAYQGEKRFTWAANHVFRFRLPVIVGGFVFVYWAINNVGWFSLATEAVILAAAMYLYFFSNAAKQESGVHKQRIREIENKLKGCC